MSVAVAVAVAVAVSGGGAVAVAGLTKSYFNHIQKDFLINVWVYYAFIGSHMEHFLTHPFEGVTLSN